MPRVLDDTTIDLIDTLVRGLASKNPYRTHEHGHKVCIFCWQREGNEHMCRCPWYIATVLVDPIQCLANLHKIALPNVSIWR